MQMLQCIDCSHVLLQCLDTFRSGASGRNGCDRRNALQNSSPTNRLLVEEWVLAMRRIEDELNALTLDQIDDVRTAFLHFENALDHHAGFFEHVGGALGRYKMEAEFNILARQLDDRLL